MSVNNKVPLQRIAMTLTRRHANVMPCTVGTPFYGS